MLTHEGQSGSLHWTVTRKVHV